MPDIFISYTSSDRHEAGWIFEELEALGHTPHMHEGEIAAGSSIYRWMEERHDAADHVLCVVSDAYMAAAYSTLERDAALWQAASKRPGFVLVVPVKPCKLPTLVDHYRRCKDLYDVPDAVARARFREFMAGVAARPKGKLGGQLVAVSNIPINVPLHFMGRDAPLAAIAAALARTEGRVAITALHGLRGVGKTTLAAAYAERHRADYRATWWIRAQTEATMRADLVALGVRLAWVEPDAKEEPALATVAERLRHEGEGILLIYDNAIDVGSLKPYLPRGGGARVLVTSNAHNWRGLAEPVEIEVWPTAVGADYLIARTGRAAERAAAEALSDSLGGLPLAHEQAAAYCERLDVGLAEYARRFAAAPAKFLDDARHAPQEHNDGLTVAKSFALAIEEAAKLHPAAEPLIVHAALLAPEPIPLYLFSEGREHLGEPLATLLVDDGLEEAIAALRAFALVDRESIADERDPTIKTDTVRLHRLLREVASARCSLDQLEEVRRQLIRALAKAYPSDIFDNPEIWPLTRRLDVLASALILSNTNIPISVGLEVSFILFALASYRSRVLSAYRDAQRLLEYALAIQESMLGPDHSVTAMTLDCLACSLLEQNDFAGAQPLLERALGIFKKNLGSEQADGSSTLHNLAFLKQQQGDFAGARSLFERALVACEKIFGPDHFEVTRSLNSLGDLLYKQGDMVNARECFERSLAISEKELVPDDHRVAAVLNNLAVTLEAQGDLAGARPLLERAFVITEKVFGDEHPETGRTIANVAGSLYKQGDLAGARQLFERVLVIFERIFGSEHSEVGAALNQLGIAVFMQNDLAVARSLFERALAIREKICGFEHPDTANSLNSLANLLLKEGDFAGARPLFERALVIREKVVGPDHPDTANSYSNLGRLFREIGDTTKAEELFERAITIGDRALGQEHFQSQRFRANFARLLLDTGRYAEAHAMAEAALALHAAQHPDHPWTKDAARVTADALDALGEAEKAAEVRARYGV